MMVDKMSQMIKESARRSSVTTTSGATYIITDPAYIIAEDEYQKFGEETKWNMTLKNPKFFTRRDHPNQEIIILKMKGTKWGDGSIKFDPYTVSVDSGLLCIAYNPAGWMGEDVGFRYYSLDEAKMIWSKIIRKF